MKLFGKPSPAGIEPKTLPEIMASYERIVIIKALQLNKFHRARTAASLGISRCRLYDRIRRLGISLAEIPSSRNFGKED